MCYRTVSAMANEPTSALAFLVSPYLTALLCPPKTTSSQLESPSIRTLHPVTSPNPFTEEKELFRCSVTARPPSKSNSIESADPFSLTPNRRDSHPERTEQLSRAETAGQAHPASNHYTTPMSRPRSSTASSFASSLRSESNRAPISNAAAPLSFEHRRDEHGAAQDDSSNSTAQALNSWADGQGKGMGTSYASQHTLKTIRGGSSPGRGSGSDDEREEEQSGPPEIRRGNPQYIIDLAPGTSGHSVDVKGRERSATFGGVPLPPSPAVPNSLVTAPHSTDQSRPHRPIPRRAISDSSLRSIPTSLHLGGGTFAERRPMLHAGLKAGALFTASLLCLWLLLRTLLPPIDEEHKVSFPSSVLERSAV